MRCISPSTGSKRRSAPAWSPAANAAVPCTSGSTTAAAIGWPFAPSARRTSIILARAAAGGVGEGRVHLAEEEAGARDLRSQLGQGPPGQRLLARPVELHPPEQRGAGGTGRA